jgi:hypothetical protein
MKEPGNERESSPNKEDRHREKIAKLAGSNLVARAADANNCDSRA